MRVSFEAGWTGADSLMTYCRAYRLSSARYIAGPTHRPAFLIPTGMSVQAIIIHPTFDLDTGHIGVAFVAILTCTDRFVVHHPTEGVLAAGTGVLTDFVDTGICLSTLIVSAAAREDGRQGATAVTICADIAFRTSTNHGSNRQGVHHTTDGGVIAWTKALTKVDTGTLDTAME